MFVHEEVQWLVGVCLPLDRVCRCKELFICKYLAKLLAVHGLASHVHGISGESPLEPIHVKHSVRSVSPS